jgi:uncharacterized protein (TIGR02271 family)
MEQRGDRFTAIEDQYAGYEVYDRNGEKLGKVDDLFVDENDQPEYIGVKMGFLGIEGTSLIPWEVARVHKNDHRIEVSVDKAQVKEGPSFNDDRDITPEYEERVYSHYGLQRAQTEGERGGYGGYYGDETDKRFGKDPGKVGPGMREGDTETGEFRGHSEEDEGVHQSHGSDLEDEDELRVQRSEEELRAGTREREAGALNVRKRVRTDREQVRVPTKHEEVSVERVPVEGREASEAEIGEDEVSMPVVEEEVVVEKRPVVKEELRLRKEVVEDEELVEEDVRKEEVDVDDQTTTGRGGRPDGTAGHDNDDLEAKTSRHNR